MIPDKSSSGIYFESGKVYENCGLCPRLDCPNRRMPYSEEMLAAYGMNPSGKSNGGICRGE